MKTSPEEAFSIARHNWWADREGSLRAGLINDIDDGMPPMSSGPHYVSSSIACILRASKRKRESRVSATRDAALPSSSCDNDTTVEEQFDCGQGTQGKTIHFL